MNYYSSPAIRTMGQKAFAMAGKTVADMSFIDLYSCFPSAVEIGCAELGLAEDDPRGLTVTGGLPYFGGAGNNYVMHSIVTMMEKVRAQARQLRHGHRERLVRDQACARHLFDDAGERRMEARRPEILSARHRRDGRIRRSKQSRKARARSKPTR